MPSIAHRSLWHFLMLLFALVHALITPSVAQLTPIHTITFWENDQVEPGSRIPAISDSIQPAPRSVLPSIAPAAGHTTQASIWTPQSLETARRDFVAWFALHGGRFHQGIRIQAALHKGTRHVRLVTKQPLTKREELVRTPQRIIIAAPRHGVYAQFQPMQALALRLLELVTSIEGQLWQPYFAILPKAPVDTALYMGEAELAELDGSYALQQVQQARHRFSQLVEQVQAVPESARLSPAWANPAALRWAVSIAEARAFTLAKPASPTHPLHMTPFLAPGADFLNHHARAHVAWRSGPATSRKARGQEPPAAGQQEDVFQILSADQYPRAGMEVFNQYGELTNAELLSHFGFALRRNDHNAIAIHLSSYLHAARAVGGPDPGGLVDIASPAGLALCKHAFIQGAGLDMKQWLDMGQLSPGVLNVARINALRAGELNSRAGAVALLQLNGVDLPANWAAGSPGPAGDSVAVSADGAAGSTLVPAQDAAYAWQELALQLEHPRHEHLMVPLETEVAAISELLEAFQVLLAQYPARQDQPGTRLQRFARIAAESEKAILEHAIAQLQDMLDVAAQ